MPTRSIDLTTEQDSFVDEMVRSGRYASASEAVRDAVRGLQTRHERDALKLADLRAHVEAGVAELDADAFTDIDDADLDAALDRLAVDSPRA